MLYVATNACCIAHFVWPPGCLCLSGAHRLLFKRSHRSVTGWLQGVRWHWVLVPVLCEAVTHEHVMRGSRDLSSIGDHVHMPVEISLTKDGAEFSASSGVLSSSITVRCAVRLPRCGQRAVHVCGGRPFYQPARASSASGAVLGNKAALACLQRRLQACHPAWEGREVQVQSAFITYCHLSAASAGKAYPRTSRRTAQ